MHSDFFGKIELSVDLAGTVDLFNLFLSKGSMNSKLPKVPEIFSKPNREKVI
jgi:hypothetical protein